MAKRSLTLLFILQIVLGCKGKDFATRTSSEKPDKPSDSLLPKDGLSPSDSNMPSSEDGKVDSGTEIEAAEQGYYLSQIPDK